MFDIRLPNITATDDAGQLAQMRSYLYQFAEQLNWALNTLENNQNSDAIVLKDAVGNIVEKTEEAKAQDTFNSIKSLIIKSADIVEAYYEEIDNLLNLSGKYVAQSEFGTYTEVTAHKLFATNDYLEQNFTKTETVDALDKRVREQEGYIRYGRNIKTTLTSSGEVTGIEIGDFSSLDGNTDRKFASFTAAGIELYARSHTDPVVIISDTKITITSAEFKNDVVMGKYKLDFSKGIAFKPLKKS